MKFTLTLLLIFLSLLSFGQMTLIEIQKVYKMDFDQFEAFALRKGYHFDEFINDEDQNGISYVKGVAKGTKYLILYDKFFRYNKHFTYQTTNTSEILNLKTQLKSSGFKIYETYFQNDEEGSKVETYRNSLFELRIFIVPPNSENSWVTYEIGYHKF